MSDISETVKNISKDGSGFFKYITTFKEEQKCELMNMIQYSVLAIIPVILILRSIKSLVPEEDESKGCLELSTECALQIIYIMVMIWITNRIIRYVPTYSGCDYLEFSPVNFILPFLIILTTMQSKLGFKLNIIADRGINMWNGKNKDNLVMAQPPQQNPNFIIQPQQHQPSQADYLDTSNLLPSNPQLSAMPGTQPNPQQMAMQQNSDFNGAPPGNGVPGPSCNIPPNTAPPQFDCGPMAANEAIGGGGFSSW